MKLRPARPEDEPFLRLLRGQVDNDRLFMNQWDGEDVEGEKRKILDLQFRAKSAHHNILRAGWETRENIVEMDAVPIGYFVVTGGGEELRLVEIAFMREWRGKGLGQMVIGASMEECKKSGRVLRLCVEKTNVRALQFYASMGFYAVDDMKHHLLLEWNSKGPTNGRLYSFAPGK